MYNSIILLRPTPDYIIMSVISTLYNNIILLRPTPDYYYYEQHCDQYFVE